MKTPTDHTSVYARLALIRTRLLPAFAVLSIVLLFHPFRLSPIAQVLNLAGGVAAVKTGLLLVERARLLGWIEGWAARFDYVQEQIRQEYAEVEAVFDVIAGQGPDGISLAAMNAQLASADDTGLRLNLLRRIGYLLVTVRISTTTAGKFVAVGHLTREGN